MRLLLPVAFAVSCGVALGQRPATPIPHPTPVTRAQGFGYAVVTRSSDHEDANGFDLAPWTAVTVDGVSTVGWKTGPVVGTEMTVIPLGVPVAPIAVKITGATYGPDPCTDDVPWRWDISLEAVTAKPFFEAAPRPDRRGDVPFEVAVVYPATPSARALDPKRIPRGDLPRGVTAATVYAAIDLEGDGRADILMLEYCCEHPERAPGDDCDYTCTKTYERVNGRWRRIDQNGPC